LSATKDLVTIALVAVVLRVSLATEAVVAATKVAAEAATKVVAAEASETEAVTEAVTEADTKVAAEAATKVAAEAASETEAAIKAAAAVADFVTVVAPKAAAVAAAFVTVAATKAEQEQDRAIKVRTVAVLRATVAVEVHGPSVKNRPIGLKVAAVKTAQVPSTAVQAIPSVVLQASHA
jgi:hypothetical protein